MKDNDKKDGIWQKLDWEKKVALCNQGIANEDSLLLTLVIMFIAFEAILFTIVIGVGWGRLWSIIPTVLGIALVFPYGYFFYKRGDAVDYWGEMLHGLWREAGQQELVEFYKGCVERRGIRRKKYGKWAVIFGWGALSDFGRFKSTRRLFTTFIPLILVIVWVVIIVVSFVC